MTQLDGPVLVIGSTGLQGGAVASELMRRGREVHALTRTPHSAAARQLAEQGATVVHGDLDDAASIRRAMSGAQAVFSVLTITRGPDVEVRQGKAVADAARDAGVEHVVYSSVDGAERGSHIPHFDSKWALEQHLQALQVPTTVLRPTAFMDNYRTVSRPALVDGTLVVASPLPPGRPFQMLAAADLGVFAADAFQQPDDHIGTAIALAGDELTGLEIAEAFADATGIPARYQQQPIEAIRSFSDDLALMYEWLDAFGYQADIAALRPRHPGLRTLRRWLHETNWQPAVPPEGSGPGSEDSP
jgi:uncharacterized protein YbjT (DUF2867 family)